MNAKERRQLENLLMVTGLAQLHDPELIQQLADLVSNWRGDRHEFLRDLLNECDADKRYEMYQAIAPKLTFAPLSFVQYEGQIAEKAGAAVSRRQMRVEGEAPKPIEIGDRLFVKVPRSDATGAIATVRCHQCDAVMRFVAETPVGAMTAARAAGWRRDPGPNKEICPECQLAGEAAHA